MNFKKVWKKALITLLAKYRSLKKQFRNRFQDVEVELYDLHKVAEPYFHYFNFILVLLAIASIIATAGFDLSETYKSYVRYLDFSIVIGFATSYLFRLILTSQRWQVIRKRGIESILMAILSIFGLLYFTSKPQTIEYLETYFGITDFLPFIVFVTKIYLIILVLVKVISAAPILLSLKRKPTQVVAFSFLGVILFGAFLLMTPSATADGLGLSFIDALFTSTSAVCVTGLIVVDTATHLTMFGQIIVLILIQVGGLGILTVATLFALYLSSGLGVGQMIMLKGSIGETKTHETFQTIKKIVGITFAIEVVGVAGYYFSWDPLLFEDNSTRFFFSVFHAVSAFCNAGFSVFTNSLADQTNALNYGINITTVLLIITGGLGFTTLWEVVKGNPDRRTHNWKFSIHTKLVIIATVTLISAGTVFFMFLEWNGVLTGYALSDKIMISIFQSVTTRTAGFNTIDIGSLNISTTLIFLLLMIIGASPASTAGGLKTTTVSVLLLSAFSAISGKGRIEFGGRRIARDTVFTALTVLILAICCLFLFTFLLTITEEHSFVDLLFEEFSAFATVGLSRGITSSLTNGGKAIIIASMFIGRVGILTLALAFTKPKHSTQYNYPSESVIVA